MDDVQNTKYLRISAEKQSEERIIFPGRSPLFILTLISVILGYEKIDPYTFWIDFSKISTSVFGYSSCL